MSFKPRPFKPFRRGLKRESTFRLRDRDVNLEMVRLGFAWRYNRYSNDPALLVAQEEAKRAKRGLWLNPTPVAPWLWRKSLKH